MLNDISFQSMSQGNARSLVNQNRMTFFKHEIVVSIDIQFLAGLDINWEFPLIVVEDWMIVCDDQTVLEADHFNLLSNFSDQNTFNL